MYCLIMYGRGARLKLTRDGLKNEKDWQAAGITLPRFDIETMRARTAKSPRWVHFGAGNIFRGYIAALAQQLLERGRIDTGIIAYAPYDYELIRRIYDPYDNLTLQVLMNADGTYEHTVIAGVAEGLAGVRDKDWARLGAVFKNPSLQMVSFTITEKGYNLFGADGVLLPEVREDLANGPRRPGHTMAQAAALLYLRYLSGGYPVALVSMDNCARNGDRLRESVLTVACGWRGNRLVEDGFIDYLEDTRRVSFPWSMIDKITPRPSERVQKVLHNLGLESAEIIETSKHTFIAPFVNAEKPQYLVIEDSFPNGRPPLESVGVYLTDRATVEKAERMKVTACLNPLHTALAVFGCLLGYALIADEMKDSDLYRLVHHIGYGEGLPVVPDPGIIGPSAFIAEVIGERLPNPNLPDTPQRIATDTSQKVGIRFGETIKAYISRDGDAGRLVFIPLAIAGWCRYLMGIDDQGADMPLSPDPLLEQLTGCLSDVKLGEPQPEKIRPILSDKAIFGVDLYEAGLGLKIENYFAELSAGPGAVRKTLQKYLND
jgi:fructuronate reductase